MTATRSTARLAFRRDAAPPGRRIGVGALLLTAVASLAGPGSLGGPGAAAAQPTPEERGVEMSGLVITGFRAEPEESALDDGFELFHARLRASGQVGLGAQYLVHAGYDSREGDLRLLDARLRIPVRPNARITVGQFKAPFSRQALMGPGELQFARRAQGPAALAPLRQVGAEVSGEVLENRLRFRAGVFNGEGRTVGNPDGGFLYAGRVEFSRLRGPVQYFDELSFTVGASVAFSEDSARDVTAAGPFRAGGLDPTGFRGERLLWGGDLTAAYRGFFTDVEYVRAEFDPAAPAPGGATQTAEGLSVDGGYKLWGGVLDVLARWDAFDPPATPRRDFLVLGANLYPGLDARIGFQYAIGLDETDGAGLSPPDQAPALSSAPSPLPGQLADGQFIVRLQATF